KILDKDVRLRQQAIQYLSGRKLFQIESQRFLGAIRPDKMTGHAAHRSVVSAGKVANFGTLDLDYARAEIGQVTSCQRRRYCLLERNDSDTLQRTRCHQY